MYCLRHIQIWYLLLSLSKSTISEDHYQTNEMVIPFNPKDESINNDIVYEHVLDDQTNNDYSNLQNGEQYKREEREIQDYGDYREEKEMPNLRKSGLGLFSWWKGEPDAKRLKGATFSGVVKIDTKADSPLTNVTVAAGSLSSDISTTLGPNGTTLGSNGTTGQNASNLGAQAASTYFTTCYTITQECAAITIGSPDMCTDMGEPAKSTTGGPMALSTGVLMATGSTSGSSVIVTDNTASNSVNTVTNVNAITQPNIANVTVAAQLTNISTSIASSTVANINISGNVSPSNTTASTAVNIFGAGMILPVFQLPVTQVVVVNTPTESPPKIKALKRINNNEESRTKNILMDNPNFKEYLFQNYSNKFKNYDLDRAHSEEATVSNGNKYERTFPLIPMKKSENENATNLFANYTIFKVKENSNQNVISNGVDNKNQLLNLGGEGFPTASTALKPFTDLDLNKNVHPTSNKIMNQLENISYNSNNYLNKINKDERKTELKQEKSEDSKLSRPVMWKEGQRLSGNLKKNTSKLLDYEGMPTEQKSVGQFIKYNDTYLSQKSNTSSNLVALCKNVTCIGNDCLTQCCSRVCQPGKCKGEDFSYLHPIPGDTTTVTSTAKSCCNSNVDKYQSNLKNENYNSSCSCTRTQHRVVRENDINDFVKFQLMHGMTAPDKKEMMNALKEVTMQIQKVNKEFHPNDQSCIQLGANGQSVHLSPMIEKHKLSKKEPKSFISSLNTEKVLDQLRATLSDSLFHANLKTDPFQKAKYRSIRNQGINDQLESIRENNMVLDKLKKETESELKRLSLLEMRRREEEELFNIEKEKELKELRTIQELIHREFESRSKSDTGKRDISDKTSSSFSQQLDYAPKESTYSKLVKNIENSIKNNEIGGMILKNLSSITKNSSNCLKTRSNSIDSDKFPELEVRNSPADPHDDTLLVLNLETNKNKLGDEND